MKEDIFKILKYGHVPLKDLMEYAEKDASFMFDEFEHDESDYCYRYYVFFPLLWDGDAYDITCEIREPNPDEPDEQNVSIHFYCDIRRSEKSSMHFPEFNGCDKVFQIKTSEDFVNALLEWDVFVGEAFLNILYHRIEILENLDKIAQEEANDLDESEKEIKEGYITMYQRIMDKFALNVQNIVHFGKIERINYHTEMDYDEYMMDKVMNGEAILIDGDYILLDPE